VLGVPVLKVVIAVDAGRNLAVLVEAAVRNTILQLRGIDTYKEFIAAIRRRWVPSRRMLDGAAVLALRLHAVGVQGQRMVLQLEAVLLGDGALACFDLGVEELLHPAAGQAHQVVVVRPSLSSKTALPDSKWLRSRMPACSNCISTR
jgi:hypothetical protein